MPPPYVCVARAASPDRDEAPESRCGIWRAANARRLRGSAPRRGTDRSPRCRFDARSSSRAQLASERPVLVRSNLTTTLGEGLKCSFVEGSHALGGASATVRTMALPGEHV